MKKTPIHSLKHICEMHTIELLYLGLALLIMGGLLLPGYILTVDMAWGPHIPSVPTTNNSWLLHEVLSILARIVGGSLVQKIILISVFVLAGVGAHRLSLLTRPLRDYPLAAYVAGVFYACNPFVYSRLMQGQWLVLIGYALLPWAVASLWRLMMAPSFDTAWRVFAWSVLVAFTSLHTVGFVVLAGVVLVLVAGRNKIQQRLLWSMSVVAAWAVANGLWLLPAVLGHSYISNEVGSFGATQMSAFATIGTIHDSVPLSSLLLEGFWPDLQYRYILPSTLITWWPAIALLGSLVILGIVRALRSRDRLGLALLALGVVAWWLGMGIAWHYSAGTTNWLIDHVPFYQGYREPQKWLMLLALAYAYFAAVGTAWLTSLLPSPSSLRPDAEKIAAPNDNDNWRPIVAGAAALLPLLLVPVLFWGAGGQLHSTQYPSDWYAVRDILDRSAGDSPVVTLPWHMYMRIGFAAPHDATGAPGRIVANPARHFFTQNVVTGNDAELLGVPPIDKTKLETTINTQIMPRNSTATDVGKVLSRYDVRYILLYKESDYDTYTWLDRQPDLRVVYDGSNIRLYENVYVVPAQAERHTGNR